MRRYGLYDTTRGLTLAVAAGVAGLLLWFATQVGTQGTGPFWAAMGIVAGAGLVTALAHVAVGWTKGLRVRVSAGTLALTFLPVLVCVAWVLLATQPGTGWGKGHLSAWSSSLGILGVVHALGLWHGVLAFGVGLVLGRSLDTLPEPVIDAVPVEERAPVAATASTADLPLAAEREPVGASVERTTPR